MHGGAPKPMSKLEGKRPAPLQGPLRQTFGDNGPHSAPVPDRTRISPALRSPSDKSVLRKQVSFKEGANSHLPTIAASKTSSGSSFQSAASSFEGARHQSHKPAQVPPSAPSESRKVDRPTSPSYQHGINSGVTGRVPSPSHGHSSHYSGDSSPEYRFHDQGSPHSSVGSNSPAYEEEVKKKSGLAKVAQKLGFKSSRATTAAPGKQADLGKKMAQTTKSAVKAAKQSISNSGPIALIRSASARMPALGRNSSAGFSSGPFSRFGNSGPIKKPSPRPAYSGSQAPSTAGQYHQAGNPFSPSSVSSDAHKPLYLDRPIPTEHSSAGATTSGRRSGSGSGSHAQSRLKPVNVKVLKESKKERKSGKNKKRSLS